MLGACMPSRHALLMHPIGETAVAPGTPFVVMAIQSAVAVRLRHHGTVSLHLQQPFTGLAWLELLAEARGLVRIRRCLLYLLSPLHAIVVPICKGGFCCVCLNLLRHACSNIHWQHAGLL